MADVISKKGSVVSLNGYLRGLVALFFLQWSRFLLPAFGCLSPLSLKTTSKCDTCKICLKKFLPSFSFSKPSVKQTPPGLTSILLKPRDLVARSSLKTTTPTSINKTVRIGFVLKAETWLNGTLIGHLPHTN